MATQFLTILVRHDYVFPVKGVRLLVRCLVHDTLNIRKVCCTSLCASMIWSVLLKEKRVCMCVYVCMWFLCHFFRLVFLLQIAYVANLLLFQQMKRQHIKTPVDIRQQGMYLEVMLLSLLSH